MMRNVLVAFVCAPVLAACVQDTQQPYNQQTPYQAPTQGAQPMQEPLALGLWKSSFGAVKIEEDLRAGQPGGGQLQGVWMYQRNGADVIGYFSGKLQGNVLQFTWDEPAQPATLEGQGYIVFDQQGQRFAGRWWTTTHDRVGEWNGWRQGLSKPEPQQQNGYGQQYGQPSPYGGQYGQPSPYGGQGYGGAYPGPADPQQPPPPNGY